MMAKLYFRFNLALSFLTIFKLPEPHPREFEPESLASSFFFFPLVGAVLGAIALACIGLGSPRLAPLPLAAWLVALWAVLTRGLHLDGLADCADGFGGAYEPARRLTIMKDSRVGAFGVIALVLDLMLKCSLIETLIARHHPAAIFVAPCLSRLAMVLTAANSRYARLEGGLGRPFIEHMKPRDWVGACVLALVLTVPRIGFTLIAQIAVLLAVVAGIRLLSTRALGGITGDVLGATNEISEIASLTLSVLLY